MLVGGAATKKLLSGIKTATEAIRLSYGARGVNAIIENEFDPYHMVVNDCESILQSIQVEDRYEKVGLDLLKELSSKAHKDSGDGRKTTCILGEKLIRDGFASGISGVELKRELDELIPIIEKKIDDQKRKITEKEVYKVATIAGESEEIGKILGEIYTHIGRDGVIVPESSGTYQTTTEYIEGIRFQDTGFLSPYMAYDEDAVKEGRKETKAVYKRPLILVTKRKIERDSDVEGILNWIIHSKNLQLAGRALVIFTNDMDSGVASRLIATHKAKAAKILIIKAPVLWKNYIFEDFSRVTHSTIVEDASGINFSNLELGHLGTCDQISVDKDETTITGGFDISEHIAELKAKGDVDSKLRLSWLTTKTCILRLGANNESELSYRRLKCYDAINASKLALTDGIVMGGGVALLNASKVLPKTAAGKLVADALIEPYRQIMLNSTGEYEPYMANLGFRGGLEYGWDAKRGQAVNMWTTGIIDAAAVVKNAVRNAISLASIVLTGKILVTIPPKTPEQIAAEALQNKGLRF